MCGIYGYIGKPKNKKLVFRLMQELAVLSEQRGTDGTGFFALTDTELITEKAPVRAKKFIRISKLMKSTIIKQNAEMFVGHNRAATIGNIDFNNTHPFVGDRYAMVHNGTFGEPAFELAKKHKVIDRMQGESDSEAVLRVFDKIGFTASILKKLETYSIVILDYTTREIFFARDPQRPMIIYDLRSSLGIRVFVSAYDIAEDAFDKLGIDFNDVFKTKSYCIYNHDPENGEVNNIKKYYTPPKKPEPKITNGGNFGRRGYPAPSIDEFKLGIRNKGDVKSELENRRREQLPLLRRVYIKRHD